MNEILSPEEQSNKTVTMVIYALYAASIIVGVTWIVAIIMNYVKRDDVAGTWLESHFTWQIRTFWYSLLWAVVGVITTFILIGFVILFADFVWFVYRIVKGWLRLNDGKPIEA